MYVYTYLYRGAMNSVVAARFKSCVIARRCGIGGKAKKGTLCSEVRVVIIVGHSLFVFFRCVWLALTFFFVSQWRCS